MTVSGWNEKYSEILKEFGYNRTTDNKSAKLLNSILDKPISEKTLQNKIKNQTVFVVGSGYSLYKSYNALRKFKDKTIIAADSSLESLLQNKITPDIVVTDLDGSIQSLKQLAKTKTIFVVHAHADNITKIPFVTNFKNCIGTTQSNPIGRIKNFGGFTDGDRAVFLASYFQAKKIILFGMDFGKRISRISKTKPSERTTKLKKLKMGKKLLEWLAQKTESQLYTTSSKIDGFQKIPFSKLDDIIT
ncbi:MAG: 6-hydroxymethylpterin diphosphokinase MptE-like protein [Nitrosopumilaceae archaeon]|nr:6-hydroxymethylpterin diphosphokinase MptE-like protein [Nitrosopumilaceae archaeon]